MSELSPQPPKFETEYDVLKHVEHQAVVSAWEQPEGSEEEKRLLADANAAYTVANKVEEEIINDSRAKQTQEPIRAAIADNQRLWDEAVARQANKAKALSEGEEHLLVSTNETLNSSVTEPTRYSSVEMESFDGEKPNANAKNLSDNFSGSGEKN